jgi:hypothetical protein
MERLIGLEPTTFSLAAACRFINGPEQNPDPHSIFYIGGEPGFHHGLYIPSVRGTTAWMVRVHPDNALLVLEPRKNP